MADVIQKVYHNPSYNYGRQLSVPIAYERTVAGQTTELPARTWLYIVGAGDDLFEYQAIPQGSWVIADEAGYAI